MSFRKILLVAPCMIALFGCGDDSKKPYLKIVGGGFNNSVVSQTVTLVIVAKRMKALPSGSVIEAEFELPDSDQKFIVTHPSESPGDKYMFESEPLHGVKKGVPLQVKLHLLTAAGGTEIAQFEKTFVSDANPDTGQ